MADEVEDKREDDAQEQGCREWEVDGGVLVAVEEIAGEAPEGQIGAGEQDQDDAGGGKDCAQEYQEFAEGGHGLNSRLFKLLPGIIIWPTYGFSGVNIFLTAAGWAELIFTQENKKRI
jgi:hypothetical protein